MGSVVDSFIDPITGKSGEKAAKGAGKILNRAFNQGGEIRAESLQDAIARLEREIGSTQSFFRPFVDSGRQGLAALRQGSTAGGLGANINQIINGDVFRGLVDERARALQNQLAAGGLTRSGEVLDDVAAIPAELALSLEGLLNNRAGSLAGIGLNASTNAAATQDNFARQIAELLAGVGNARATGIESGATGLAQGNLAGAQARAQGTKNILDFGANFIPKIPGPG